MSTLLKGELYGLTTERGKATCVLLLFEKILFEMRLKSLLFCGRLTPCPMTPSSHLPCILAHTYTSQ